MAVAKIAYHQTQERVSFGISLTGGEVFHRRLTYNKTAPAVVWEKTTNWHQPQHNLDLSSTLLADRISVRLIPRKLLRLELSSKDSLGFSAQHSPSVFRI